MSEKGCLISNSFNTLSVNNKVETKGLFSKEHTKASFHVQQDQTGNTTSDTKDIFNQLTYDGDNSDIPENTTITLGQKRIDFPSKSIIESLSIILKRDNYLVKNAHGANTDVFVNISISNNKGESFVPLFDDTLSGANIILLKGESSANNGSFLSINTIIPIISNYQLNTREERIMAISTGGYVLNDGMDLMGLSSTDDDPTDSNPDGFLYNDSNDTQYIDIQLSRSNSSALTGANQPASEVDRKMNGIYNKIRDIDHNIGPDGNLDVGAAFTVFAKFTTGIN